MPLLSGRKGRVAMGEDMSRVLIETMVRKGIREIQEDPERSARNLVDMAIHFSPEGRFSRALFDNVQRMLRDEDSAYYALVSDMVHHMDAERLLTFGMLLGYDGFTLGAQRIRETEAAEGFDIPWSLIRIQQRNGRIDRYGQTNPPEITSLLLDPDASNNVGELHVLRRLLEREDQAHKVIGNAGALMGKHSVKLEEDAIRDVLAGSRDFDDVVADPAAVASGDTDGLDAIDAFLAQLDSLDSPEDTAVSEHVPSLYDSEIDYLEDALREAFHDMPEAPAARSGVAYVRHKNDTAQLEPPADLRRRLDFLPQEYVADRKVKEKFLLATSLPQGQQILDLARTGQDGSTWPSAHYLGPLHPVTDWATDLALANLSRGQIPAVTGDVKIPTTLLMGTLSNKRGQVVSRSFIASADIFNTEIVQDPVAWLKEKGLGIDAVNRGSTRVPDDYADLISSAVDAARGQLVPTLDAAETQARQRIRAWSERADAWQQGRSDVDHYSSTLARSERLIADERQLVNALMPDQQLVRPLVLILPSDGGEN